MRSRMASSRRRCTPTRRASRPRTRRVPRPSRSRTRLAADRVAANRARCSPPETSECRREPPMPVTPATPPAPAMLSWPCLRCRPRLQCRREGFPGSGREPASTPGRGSALPRPAGNRGRALARLIRGCRSGPTLRRLDSGWALLQPTALASASVNQPIAEVAGDQSASWSWPQQRRADMKGRQFAVRGVPDCALRLHASGLDRVAVRTSGLIAISHRSDRRWRVADARSANRRQNRVRLPRRALSSARTLRNLSGG